MNIFEMKKRTPKDFLQYALEPEVFPLYEAREIDGIIVKNYHFIRGHSKISNRQEFPAKDIEQKDYSLLSIYKSEIENQLELNHQYCMGQYSFIKDDTRYWLEDKFKKIGWSQDLNEEQIGLSEEEIEQLASFVRLVHEIILLILVGREVDSIRDAPKGSLTLPTEVEISSPTNSKKREPVLFSISGLLDKLDDHIKNIERVVSRSVDLYFEYVNIHSHIYEFDREKFLEKTNSSYGNHQLNSDWIEQKWYKIREDKSSDRQADLELQKRYKDKFDLSISTSQIQRLTGRQ